MTNQRIIDDRLNQVEQSLINQKHLTQSAEFELQLDSLSKYFHLMSDEDREYYNHARTAWEDKLAWNI